MCRCLNVTINQANKSFSLCNSAKIPKINEASAYAVPNKKISNEKTSNKIRKLEGSMTVEAALTFPIFLIVMVCMLFFFRIMEVQLQVECAIQYTSRTMAVYAAGEDVAAKILKQVDRNKTNLEGQDTTLNTECKELLERTGLQVVSSAAAKKMIKNQLREADAAKKYIKNGLKGISCRCDTEGDTVDVLVTYQMRLPISFFSIKGYKIIQRSRSRKWTGYQKTQEDTTYVYIAEHGTVYHLSENCTYLDLSIQRVPYSSIAGLRNKSGGRYQYCEDCARKQKECGGYVWITDYGDRYHSQVECSGLKRTVYRIPLEEVGDRGLCSKCRKNQEK